MTDEAGIRHWMLLHLAVLAGEPVESLSAEEPLARHDLDSVDAVQMALELEKALGLELEPELLMDGRQNVAALAAMLAGRLASA
ncbi:phosphopantetheine-binding protein [Roseomonas sp. GC11]|uniref:phosphopantetheine-binding protein n=1 Tax=Roseomonas sp. GC11 TaxID=2950546 RepID=UPI002109E195|nr:phosphopantetheine-binding protein [Roseomonas sp. GC11]MCQ4162084.1 phosphopantetheine-binding protein [Roseomonas sp. GC11]